MGARTVETVIGSTITVDVLATVVSALAVAVIWLARQISKADERIARLEGRLNGHPSEPHHDR